MGYTVPPIPTVQRDLQPNYTQVITQPVAIAQTETTETPAEYYVCLYCGTPKATKLESCKGCGSNASKAVMRVAPTKRPHPRPTPLVTTEWR